MPEVKIIERNNDAQPGFDIRTILGNTPTKGDVGIEIEIEGTSLPKSDSTPSPWGYHIDHSLRGKENGEYVLNKPVAFSEVEKSLDTLWKVFKAKKSTFDDSNRTSVHVHLNCQDFHLNRLTVFVAAWYAVEEFLTQWCGEMRVGNLFCLRGTDATATIRYFKRFIESDGQNPFPDILHYAGLNPNALAKYGSLEIRTMRGVHDPKIILTWVQILEKLYRLSEKFTDPREFVATFSSGGPLSFLDLLLGDKAQLTKDDISWSTEDIVQSMYRGIRLAQDICYCRDWDLYQATVIKPDPFKRDMKKISQKVVEAALGGPVGGPSVPPMPTGTFTLSSAAAQLNAAVAAHQQVQSQWEGLIVPEDPFYEDL